MYKYEEQFNTNQDYPKQNIIKHHYIILYTPRSGSHLIGHYLHKTGQMGFPLEYFNPNNFSLWERRFGTKGIIDTLNMIKKYRTSPNGCFGCKLGHTEFEKICSEYELNNLFPEAKFIRIRRLEILRQAISLAKARTTGSFISSQKSVTKAKYSYKLIDDLLKEILIENSRLDYILARRKFPYLEVYYEDFLENPNQILKEIAFFVGVELKSNDQSSSFLLPKKQSDQSNQEFKNQFIQETERLGLNKDFEFLQNIKRIPTKILAQQLLSRINYKFVRFMKKIK